MFVHSTDMMLQKHEVQYVVGTYKKHWRICCFCSFAGNATVDINDHVWPVICPIIENFRWNCHRASHNKRIQPTSDDVIVLPCNTNLYNVTIQSLPFELMHSSRCERVKQIHIAFRNCHNHSMSIELKLNKIDLMLELIRDVSIQRKIDYKFFGPNFGSLVSLVYTYIIADRIIDRIVLTMNMH